MYISYWPSQMYISDMTLFTTSYISQWVIHGPLKA